MKKIKNASVKRMKNKINTNSEKGETNRKLFSNSLSICDAKPSYIITFFYIVGCCSIIALSLIHILICLHQIQQFENGFLAPIHILEQLVTRYYFNDLESQNVVQWKVNTSFYVY